ncbi:hypothetical protein CERZMDRAFT_38077 [Cercospora zeae-maydis SCOH1-5]|uniref:Pentatricopeptide repeat domain-containing protein n=1 Tax=Cercospora zeae-maydis SCOH1-5 TaxID=717836 RepID=A0A6A6FK64_9PEZI|nr:hypothetical protein CERZMDRAFT_38077 [Cercospora zeae-maydis SCOH1-5]
MGAHFERWLSRPSTLCFLRRVLDTTADAPPCPHWRQRIAPRRHVHNNSQDPEKWLEEHDGSAPTRRRYYRGTREEDTEAVAAQKRADATEYALRKVLGGSRGSPANRRLPPRAKFTSLSGHLLHPARSARLVQMVVESSRHMSDLGLWAELAQYAQRHEGLRGVIIVWDGMRQYGIDLPTVGEDADMLWTTFITSGIEQGQQSHDRRFFLEVLQYAVRLNDRSGKVYPKLYQTAVGTILSVNASRAPRWARYIAQYLGEEHADLHSLATSCAASDAFKAFKAIYREQRGTHKLYDYFIPELLKQGDVEQTLKWHKFFISNGDGPGAEVVAMPLVQELFKRDGDRSLSTTHRRESGSESHDFVVPRDGVSIYLPAMSRATMSTLVGEVHGIKQREVSDSFVAKMLATRAFPLDMVFSGLGVIGVETIGPMALREIALRAGSAPEFILKLGMLQDMNIATTDAIYCRLLVKLARDRSDDLYEALLASDQHPEAFEDSTTQQALLASFLDRGDLTSAQVTLVGLSLRGGITQSRAWNCILHHHVKRRQFGLVAETTRQMQAVNIAVTGGTLACMHRYLLPERKPGHAPPQYMLDEYLGVPPLQFVTNMHIYAAQRDVTIRPNLWIELMKRYGMLQKWEELEHLAHWLPQFYWTRKKSYRTIMLESGSRANINVPLWTIFSSSMRSAFIVWGFQHAATKRLLSEADCSQTWARGVLLLRKLNEVGFRKPDMQTSPNFVRRVLLQQMWTLFGPAYSTKRINVLARRCNRLPLAHFIQHANAIWDGQLFDLDPRLYEPQNSPQLLVSLFGRIKRVGQKRRDRVNVLAYARAIAEGHRIPPVLHRSVHQRRRAWEMSPFRIAPSRTGFRSRVPGRPIPSSRRRRRLLSAHSLSSRPAPNRQDILEIAPPC